MSLLRDLISQTHGAGPSSTKAVYLNAGYCAAWSATLATAGGVGVYIAYGTANAVYWGAVTALWTAALGFATSAKKTQNQHAKEIAIAGKGDES